MHDKTLTGGEDKCFISLWLDWTECQGLAEWSAELLQAQEWARLDPHERTLEQDPAFKTGDIVWRVEPHGFNAADNRRCYFPLVMKCGGVTLALSLDRRGDSTTPNCRIEIGSLPLICESLESIWAALQSSIADGLGAPILKHRLSQVDACADLCGVSISSLMCAFHTRHWICRATNAHDYITFMPGDDGAPVHAQRHTVHKVETGFTVGSYPILCRAYDKWTEVQRDEEKRAAMIEHRWGGSEPDAATRIEFQLRRDALRSFIMPGCPNGIETVEQWVEHRAAVCRYLMLGWLRFPTGHINRSHTERSNELHPVWHAGLDAFAAWTGHTAEVAQRATRSVKVEAVNLVKQAVGSFMAALVRCGVPLRHAQANIGEVADLCREAVLRCGENAEFWTAWREKEGRQEASIPADSLTRALNGLLAIRGCCVTQRAPAAAWLASVAASGGPPPPATAAAYVQ